MVAYRRSGVVLGFPPLLVGSHLFHACSDRPGVRRSMRRDPACRAARAALAHIELPRRPDGPRAILGRTGFRPGNGAVRMRPMAQSVGSCPTGGSDSVEKQNQVRGDTSSDLLQFDGASNETRTHDPPLYESGALPTELCWRPHAAGVPPTDDNTTLKRCGVQGGCEKTAACFSGGARSPLHRWRVRPQRGRIPGFANGRNAPAGGISSAGTCCEIDASNPGDIIKL